MKLPIGTKSILFGAHQFLIHPLFLAVAWGRLYGFPCDPRLWIVFLIHDWGYWGLDDLDDEVGQRHPEWAGRVLDRLFGKAWGDLARGHSRHYARQIGIEPSPLCAADKLVLVLTPQWLYLPMVRATGELEQYMDLAKRNQFYAGGDPEEWLRLLRRYWLDETRRLAPDQAWKLGGLS